MISTFIGLIVLASRGQASPLTASDPIVVPGGAGSFDFMNVDRRNRLVFVAHPGKTGIAVVHLNTGKAIEVDTEAAVNGVGVDSRGKRIFAAGPGNTLLAYDTTTWKKIGSLHLDGPGDCVQFDAKRGVVYVDNDDGTNLWVVDPSTMKIVNTVTIKEAPEYMEYDNTRNRIFQAIKTTNTVQIVDADTRKVVDEWTLGDVKSPHGLALDRRDGKLFIAGKNGKLVVLDATSGKLLQTLDITSNSDQIAYDAKLKRLYCPGNGLMNVIEVSPDGAKIIGSVPVPKGCHSVTVDPQTDDVWVAYADAKDSYVMKFTVTR